MSVYKIIITISFILAILSIFILGLKSGLSLNSFQIYIDSLGSWSPLVFMLIYSIAPVFFIPVTPLAIMSGVLFGPIEGTIYAAIGANIGACISFLISRYLLKEYIDEKAPSSVTLIKEKIEKHSWKFLFYARITPILPFNFQNYFLGVSNISLKMFFIVSLLSLVFTKFPYVYLGYTGKNLLSGNIQEIWPAITALLLVIVISFLPQMYRKYKSIQH